MEFRKSTQEDFDYVRSKPYEGNVKNYPYCEVPDENAVTALYEGQIVGIGGVQIIWPGVGTFWLMLTDDCMKKGVHGILALSAIKEMADKLAEKNGLWRMQASVQLGFPEAIKMIEWLGFRRECLMKEYLPNCSDAYLYAKIRKV